MLDHCLWIPKRAHERRLAYTRASQTIDIKWYWVVFTQNNGRRTRCPQAPGQASTIVFSVAAWALTWHQLHKNENNLEWGLEQWFLRNFFLQRVERVVMQFSMLVDSGQLLSKLNFWGQLPWALCNSAWKLQANHIYIYNSDWNLVLSRSQMGAYRNSKQRKNAIKDLGL